MNIFFKVLLTIFVLISITQAKHSFQTYDDMCEKTDTQECTNNKEQVKSLQIALNRSLNLHLKPDGKWGNDTKNAVLKFQKKYNLTPIVGYVGKKTKTQLDKVFNRSNVRTKTKYSFLKYDDMCEKTDIQECENNKDQVKNLQLALNRILNIHLKPDGKWGNDTKKAVLKFQKKYNLTPIVGYVGKKTKSKLDNIFRHTPSQKIKIAKNISSSNYLTFKRITNLRKSFKVFKDKKLLARANRRNTKLKIDISEQRLKLLVNGKVALDSPCTTGAKHKFEPNTKIYRDKHTPIGTYKVREKIVDKRSTIFGDLYRNGKKIYHGDRRKYRGSWKGVKYVGASLKHWMRLTSGGIGLHASKYVKRYPGTNGCIRLPHHVAKTVFKKVKNGTKVSIVN